MAQILTRYDERVIGRLIETGRFATKDEVVRAGLKALEEKYVEDYLHPPPLQAGALDQVYRERSHAEHDEELAAATASHRPTSADPE